jgi:hypothetical protein
MRKLKMVANVREVIFKYWSTRAKALAVAIPGSWALLPVEWQVKYFPEWVPQYMARATIALCIVSFLCQLIKQDLPNDNNGAQ